MTTRFIPSNYSKVLILPAVSSLAAPTRSEINAGTILCSPGNTTVNGLIAINGLETQPNDIAGPDANSLEDKMYKGRKTLPTATLEFWDNSTGTSSIRTALAEDTTGYLVIMKYGDVEARRCETWPGRVSNVTDSQITNANELARFVVSWVVTGSPSKTAVIPAP